MDHDKKSLLYRKLTMQQKALEEILLDILIKKDELVKRGIADWTRTE